MLQYIPETRGYVVHCCLSGAAEVERRCREAALDFSVTASARLGYKVFQTKDHYAALPFWDIAMDPARAQLAGLRAVYEASFAEQSDYDPPMPPGVHTLDGYQRAGIKWALERNHSLIGDAPGLGKTAQAIAVGNAMKAKRVLVVCPGGIRLQWEQAVRYWSTLRDVTTYPVLNSRNGINEKCNYVIISYDLTRSEHLHEFLCRQHYDLMVIDEAHYLKTPDALRTQALFGSGEQSHHRYVALADRAEKVVGLTGTPLPNRPRECYTISRKFDWGAIDWMSEERFRGRFNPSFFGDEKVGRTAELQARLRCNFMIRREEHVLGLQPPRYEVLPIEPDGAIRKALQSEGLIQFQDDDFAKPAIGGDVSTVRKEMGMALAPHAAKHINMVLDGGVNKLVVFVHHHCVREYLEEHVKGKFVRIIGGMSAQAKDLAKQQFIKDPDVTWCVANLVAGGTGLDGLQEVCCHAVLAESSWVPGENDQAIRRLQRKGQERFVHAQFLVAPGSISERILGSAVGKAKGIHAALDKRHGVVR